MRKKGENRNPDDVYVVASSAMYFRLDVKSGPNDDAGNPPDHGGTQ